MFVVFDILPHDQDATVLKDDEKRHCAVHSDPCCVPDIDAFGAGFSCTSYSNLSKDASKNATAMHKARENDPEAP